MLPCFSLPFKPTSPLFVNPSWSVSSTLTSLSDVIFILILTYLIIHESFTLSFQLKTYLFLKSFPTQTVLVLHQADVMNFLMLH